MIDRTKQPAISPVKEFNLTPPVVTELPNAVKLHVMDTGDQEVVRLDLVFAGGKMAQDTALQALFTNRMLREGSSRYTSAGIAEKLDFYGAWLELSSSMGHSLVTLYCLGKYYRETVEVVASMIKEPLFPEKELRTIAAINKQQFIVNNTKVDFKAQRAWLQAVFGRETPYGQVVREEDYDLIDRETLLRFYRTCYHPGNCTVFLSGKITPEVEQLTREHFGTSFGCPGQENRTGTFVPVPESFPQKRIWVEVPDAVQSSVKLGMVSASHDHPDYHRLRVLITLLGGYFGSRLMSNIREEKGYTYGISAGLLTYPHAGALMITTETANRFVEPVIGEVYQEIDRLCNVPVPPEELEMVRNYMLGEMCRNFEGAFSLADAWIYVHTNGLPLGYYQESLQAIQTVSAGELLELAGKWLCKKNLKEVIAGGKID